jgi:hypothetical protein
MKANSGGAGVLSVATTLQTAVSPYLRSGAPLAFKAIMTLPQPSAFAALVKGFDGECPCCRR